MVVPSLTSGGSKSIGQYGGYETFVDRLIGEHENEPSIKYHVACKANGDGFMDETKLSGISKVKKDKNGVVREFIYKNAHVFKIPCPNIGSGVAIYYDRAAVMYSIVQKITEIVLSVKTTVYHIFPWAGTKAFQKHII